jgi:hypothetical protein
LQGKSFRAAVLGQLWEDEWGVADALVVVLVSMMQNKEVIHIPNGVNYTRPVVYYSRPAVNFKQNPPRPTGIPKTRVDVIKRGGNVRNFQKLHTFQPLLVAFTQVLGMSGERGVFFAFTFRTLYS